MRRCWIIAALLVLMAAACSGRVKKPEVFLDEAQMIDVMTDSYLIEAELNQMKSKGENVSQLQLEYYSQFFEHYGITDSIFEENMRYYTHHPDVLERVMDSVVNRFVKAQ